MLLVGRLCERSGQFTFDRNDPQARIKQAQEVNAALVRGESVVIYPEGTFTSIAGIRPFQLGAFKAAVDTHRPICPVSVRKREANSARQNGHATAGAHNGDLWAAD